jgi:hypothetical protein
MYNAYLKSLIANSGLKQQDLSRILGIPNADITNIINGVRVLSVKKRKHGTPPNQKRIQRYQQLIADYFNQPVNNIF